MGLASVQLLGGAALALGLLTRPLALLFAIEMIVSVILHYRNGYTFAAPGGGYEFPPKAKAPRRCLGALA
jgi:putative oxidoreductase